MFFRVRETENPALGPKRKQRDDHDQGACMVLDQRGDRANEQAGALAVFIEEPAMAIWRDNCRPEQSPLHGTKHRGSADAKAGC
jgi:hypothetical protein